MAFQFPEFRVFWRPEGVFNGAIGATGRANLRSVTESDIDNDSILKRQREFGSDRSYYSDSYRYPPFRRPNFFTWLRLPKIQYTTQVSPTPLGLKDNLLFLWIYVWNRKAHFWNIKPHAAIETEAWLTAVGDNGGEQPLKHVCVLKHEDIFDWKKGGPARIEFQYFTDTKEVRVASIDGTVSLGRLIHDSRTKLMSMEIGLKLFGTNLREGDRWPTSFKISYDGKLRFETKKEAIKRKEREQKNH